MIGPSEQMIFSIHAKSALRLAVSLKLTALCGAEARVFSSTRLGIGWLAAALIESSGRATDMRVILPSPPEFREDPEMWFPRAGARRGEEATPPARYEFRGEKTPSQKARTGTRSAPRRYRMTHSRLSRTGVACGRVCSSPGKR
ncbi:MAG: hypothetical protein AMXMBFR22_31780 [Phycisphaerae bacterium]